MNQGNAGLTGLSAVNIDCGLLPYCAKGTGTATTLAANPPDPTAPADHSLWREFDLDHDGYPNLPNASARFNNGGVWFDMSTRPGVGRAKINAGDTYTFLGTASNGVNSFATTLPPYFVTTPAIKSITDSASTHTIGYPIKAGDPGTGHDPNAPDNRSGYMALSSDLVTVTFWRPQRNAVAGAETSGFRDMGGLGYFFSAGTNACTRDDIKSVSTGTSVQNEGVFDYVKDSAADTAPDAGNLITVTLDVGACFDRTAPRDNSSRANGLRLDLEARTIRGDSTGTMLWVTLPPKA
jgi:hypothetical protein